MNTQVTIETAAQPVRPKRRIRFDALDLETVEAIFEPDYILDTHETVVLFRNPKF